MSAAYNLSPWPARAAEHYEAARKLAGGISDRDQDTYRIDRIVQQVTAQLDLGNFALRMLDAQLWAEENDIRSRTGKLPTKHTRPGGEGSRA